MRRLLPLLMLCGIAFGQPSTIPTGLSGPAYQTAVTAWLNWLNANKQATITGSPGSWPSFAPVATSGSASDLTGTLNAAQLSANQKLRSPGAYFSTAAATTVCSPVGYSGTITGVKIIADSAITATVDVKTVALGSFTGAASASSITASSPATITSGTNASPSIAGWTAAVSANTVVCFVPSGITAGSATYFIAQLQIATN